MLPEGRLARLAYFAVFFFSGVLVASYPRVLESIIQSRLIGTITAFGAIAFGVIATMADTQYQAWGIPLSMCGIAVAVHLASRADSMRWARPVRFIGRSSLVFYVAHFPIIYATWELLNAWGLADLQGVTGVLFIVAIGGCVALTYLQRYRPFCWLFRAPGPRNFGAKQKI